MAGVGFSFNNAETKYRVEIKGDDIDTVTKSLNSNRQQDDITILKNLSINNAKDDQPPAKVEDEVTSYKTSIVDRI